MISSKKIQNLTVVLGDANSFSRQILRSALGAYGVHRVFECRDGIEVLKAMQHLIPSVVVIDTELMGLTAMEVTRALRRNPRTQMLPVVLMSGAPTRKLVTESVFAGAHEFVAKPFSSQTLFERVSRAVFVHRDFLRTKTFFGPEPYGATMRELLVEEASQQSYIAALTSNARAFSIRMTDGEFVSA